MKKNNKKINLYFILAGENLFHPHYLNGVLKGLDKSTYEVVGITVAKEKYKSGRIDFLIKMFDLWGIMGFISMASLSFIRTLFDQMHLQNSLTIHAIAKANNISYQESFNVNKSDHISYLEEKNIDIIVSSNGQIFKRELLLLPKIGCINRHSALLPKYGGVLPVFWALFYNEKKYGVSMHFMVKKIDEGAVIFQSVIPINSRKSLFAHYVIAFHESISSTIEALDIVIKKKVIRKQQNNKVDYFSFPTKAQLITYHNTKSTFLLEDIAFYINSIW